MSPLRPFELRVLPLTDLIPAPYNPRHPLRPTDPAYRKLRASLQAFGLVEPLVWNELTGHVVGGHARLALLRELGVAEVPVSVVRLDLAREKALNVVLNNAEAQGRYDSARLAEILDDLRDLPELELTGFDESALANFRLEPIALAAPEDAGPERVEVLLVTDPGTYADLEPQLDDLVRSFDLEAHVTRRG